MNFELACYIVLCGAAILSCIFNKRVYAVIPIYIFSLFYLWVVRSAGFDYDMKGYATFLDYMPSFSTESIYYTREFVYWFGSAYINTFTQDHMLTLWIIDVIWATLLVYSMGNNKRSAEIPLYVVPFMLVFFPVLMGYENIYRQLIASMFIVFAFFGSRNILLSLFFGIVALFTHNSAVIYFPLLFVYGVTDGLKKPKVGLLNQAIFFFLYVGMIGGVYYSALGDSGLGKSSSTTGMSLTLAYLFLFVLMFVIALIVCQFKLKKFTREYFSLIYATFTFLLCLPILGGAQAERIGMMLLIIVVPLFATSLDRSFSDQNQRVLIRFLFVLTGIMPTFLFSSAMNFLLTSARLAN